MLCVEQVIIIIFFLLQFLNLLSDIKLHIMFHMENSTDQEMITERLHMMSQGQWAPSLRSNKLISLANTPIKCIPIHCYLLTKSPGALPPSKIFFNNG